MYNPKQEEYLLTEPRDVLPEFIVQYKYGKRRMTGSLLLRLTAGCWIACKQICGES